MNCKFHVSDRRVNEFIKGSAERHMHLQKDVIDLLERIDQRIGVLQATLINQRTVKEWYTTAELAAILGKAEFTTRQWARLGRIHAVKKRSGRGKHAAWVISHEELLRIQREGLLPLELLVR